jgi:hypothetical protein
MVAPKLRFAIMCPGLSLPAWQAACIRVLLESGLAEPVLLILEASPPRGYGGLGACWGQRSRLLFRLYGRCLVRPFVRAFRRVDMSDELDHLPRLACRVEERGFSQYFAAPDVAAIRGRDLSFVLRFGFGIVRGEILRCARYGIWSYHHGDERVFRGSPAGFWELFHDRPDTGVILQRLGERLDNGTVLCRGNFRTAITYAGNLRRIYAAAIEWPTLCARRIASGDTAFLTAPPEPSAARVLRPPTNSQFVRFALRQCRRAARRLARAALFADDWNIGFAVWHRRDLLNGLNTADVAWALPSSSGMCLADPMLLEEPGGAVRVFAEAFDYRSHGRIVSMAWPQEFTTATARSEFDPGSHVSYPFVFVHDGAVFMAPETRALGRLALLQRAENGAWREFCRIADDVELTDPTLIHHDGRWWLFCCDGSAVPDTRLMIYHALRLDGPWQPHLLNPVKFDVRSARPAGPLFTFEGALYRPAQDGSQSYGGAVTINRIERLTPETFAESPVARLEAAPNCPYPDGVHTLAVGDGKILVDGKRTRLRFGLLPQQLRRLRARRHGGAAVGRRIADQVGLLPLGPARR